MAPLVAAHLVRDAADDAQIIAITTLSR